MSFPNQNIRDSFIKELSWLLIDNHTNYLSNFNNPQEPDFVAFLVRDIVTNTGVLLKKYLPNANSKVYGVFCHQSPKVKFQNPNPNQKDCAELGDLLIVYTETINKRSLRSHALLLQAKCTDKMPHSIGSNEMHQLYLYQNWPHFTYVTPSMLANQSRKVPVAQNYEGANYLLFSRKTNPNPFNLCYLVFRPAKTFTFGNNNYHGLASIIGNMLDFSLDFSRDFTLSSHYIQNDDWSNMINDILRVAVHLRFNRRKVNLNNQSRIFTFQCINGIQDNTIVNLSPAEPETFNSDFIQDGMSTIYIHVDKKEE